MSLLNQLRSLLIDTRIALRGALPAFDEDPLRARMEQAIREISEFVMPPAAANTKTTAQQVALAWQTVSRGLKLSHPELYDELGAKVMILLNERELVEPVTELLQLEAQVKQLEAKHKSVQTRLAERDKNAGEARVRLEQIYQALATAVPQADGAPDEQGRALQRLEALTAQARAPRGTSGRASAPTPPAESPVPGRSVLQAVATGQRQFTRDQREWGVAECLALTGWQFTPIELIERGDPWMAQQLLAAPNAPG